MKRRDFLKFSSLLGLSATTGGFVFGSQAQAATLPADGYKALVCIMLAGGNDSFNMFLPVGAGYDNYARDRGNLAIANNPLSLPNDIWMHQNPYITAPNDTNESAYRKGYYDLGGELGVNAVMPELAHLLKQGDGKIIANIGNLQTFVDKQMIQDRIAQLPLFLFAHNHQTRELHLGRADTLDGPGWAGRIADDWLGGYNDSYPLGLNFSFAGASQLLVGTTTSPLVMRATNPVMFDSLKLNSDDRYNKEEYNRRALFHALHGRSEQAYSPLTSDRAPYPVDFRDLDPIVSQNLLRQAYETRGENALNILGRLNEDWDAIKASLVYQSTDVYGNPLFSVPSAEQLGLNVSGFGGFIRQMEAVARMIKIGSDRGYGRQIFYVSLGSFDTHSSQVDKHPMLLRELSLGVHSFDSAMRDLGLHENVATFSMSDFGRTVSNNGDGTDHGWGSHQFVLGGGMKNFAIQGQVPDLSLGSDNDYSSSGRIIPTTSQEQLFATLVNWFGVPTQQLTTLFPNLGNFKQTSEVESALIDGLFS